MALSGTLETFSLPDVLRLLSSTKKTGLLALDGDRGNGRVWVEDGEIVAAQADLSIVDDVDAVLFELLRFVDGAFEFDAGAPAPEAGGPRPVDDALAVAQARLEEWRDIEAVVPSLDVRVRMVPEIEGPVEVDGAMWRLLARVGTGASGHDVAHHLAEGEFEVCRSLRGLVDAGLVEVTELGAAAPDIASQLDDVVEPEEIAGIAEIDEIADAVDAVDAVEVATLAPDPDPADELAAIFGSASPATTELTFEPTSEPTSGDDVLADLAHLSPKAAAAVEATWSADPGDGVDDAPGSISEVPAGEGDDLDQNLLLRFLSSAKH